MTRRFKQVDVFTADHFRGNPVAVVLDAEGISDGDMQRIANWTNLAETTFFLPPTDQSADYRLRIFTPQAEMPFAGHPTVGSAHAAIEAGIVSPKDGKLRQECGIGIVDLSIEVDGDDRLIFFESSPRIVYDFEESAEAISDALRAPVSLDPPPTSVDVGAVWILCLLENSDAVSRLKPDLAAVARLSDDFNVTGICAFALTPQAHPEETGSTPSARPEVSKGERGDRAPAIHLRAFAPWHGIPEDPVTGSANACIGRFLAHTGLIENTGREYTATQGTELGRDGRVHVRVSEDGRQIHVGGRAVTTIDGTITLA